MSGMTMMMIEVRPLSLIFNRAGYFSKMGDCDMSIDLTCRDKTAALHLKFGAIAAILSASALGVAIPLIGKKLSFLRTDSNFFFVAKAFSAGVILATGFVHMLPDAQEALTNPCLSEHPWAKFPWFGFIAMLSALLTLVVDFVGTQYYERKHSHAVHAHGDHHLGESLESASARIGIARIGIARISSSRDPMQPESDGDTGVEKNDLGSKQEHSNDRQIHIVGMKAHAASHGHNHADGKHGAEQGHTHRAHNNVTKDATTEEAAAMRHVVISQVLELGILAHSIIIGISLGVSESPCTIKPLMAALVFHQFFEGFALGGCISQAGYKYAATALMAVFFAVTTPLGITVGIGIASSYNENSSKALIIEGLFDSVSAGILVYMSLVDLIAADFLSKRLRCDRQLQVLSYLALFGGAGVMSALAVWA